MPTEFDPPVVTIVIVTYQRLEYLKRCLAAIQQQHYRPLQVIVFDNGGELTPAIFDSVKGPGIDTILMQSETNIGAGAGRNRAVDRAVGDVVLFVDDDAILQESNAVERVLQNFEAHPESAAFAFFSQNPEGTTNPYEIPVSARQGTDTDLVEVASFTAVLAAVRKNVFIEVGGFPDYPWCMEEYDLGLKLLDAGHKILYDRSISVIHYKAQQGHSLRREAGGALACSVNRVRTAFRLLPFPLSWSMIFTRLLRLLWLSGFNLSMAASYVKTLVSERNRLGSNRAPIAWRTIWYILSIRAWTTFV